MTKDKHERKKIKKADVSQRQPFLKNEKKYFAKVQKIIDMNENLIEELHHAAFEVLLLHPSTTRDKWVQTLMDQYPTEVADALGTDTKQTRERLEKMWCEDYTDTAGVTRSYADWAAQFATENDITEYYKTIPM